MKFFNLYKKSTHPAFTLAEVLITLGIIGVVAAMTIPTLMNQTNDAELKTAWKKSFSTINQANLSFQASGNSDYGGVFTDANSFRNSFTQYMKTVKTCDSGTATGADGCWHTTSSWKYFQNQTNGVDYSGDARAILSDGSFIMFELKNPACDGGISPNSDSCGYIFNDVNGFKKPNTVGKDIFISYVTKTGRLFPCGISGDYFDKNPSTYNCDKTNTNSLGNSCAAYSLYN